jgi:DNA-binding NtrC family response regulator
VRVEIPSASAASARVPLRSASVIILCDDATIERADLHPGDASTETLRDALDLSGTLSEAAERATRVIERLKITDALRGGTRADAAEALGISMRTLAAKMKEHGIDD